MDGLDTSRRVVVSNMVLNAVRPVLIVPAHADGIDLSVVLVTWKETRQARRSIADAVLLLTGAARIVVVEIAAEEEVAADRHRLEDVALSLDRHGIASECFAATSIGDGAAQLRAIVNDNRADVIVAGADGHSRQRERVLGGVTRDLLMRPNCGAFVSH